VKHLRITTADVGIRKKIVRIKRVWPSPVGCTDVAEGSSAMVKMDI
jgi:hypothetical protein